MCDRLSGIQWAQEILEGVKDGDPDQCYMASQILLHEGPEFEPEVLILLSEAIAEMAVQLGSEKSREFLVDIWPSVKTMHLKRLVRKGS